MQKGFCGDGVEGWGNRHNPGMKSQLALENLRNAGVGIGLLVGGGYRPHTPLWWGLPPPTPPVMVGATAPTPPLSRPVGLPNGHQ